MDCRDVDEIVEKERDYQKLIDIKELPKDIKLIEFDESKTRPTSGVFEHLKTRTFALSKYGVCGEVIR